MGCIGTHIYPTQDDPLAAAQLRERANTFVNIASATQVLNTALERQSLADTHLQTMQPTCYRKFLVQRCLDRAQTERNQSWDAAQIDLSAARLYLRQQEAEVQRIALSDKLKRYQKQEQAQAGQRAANARAYTARQAAYAQRQTQIQNLLQSKAPERAQKNQDFATKMQKIQAIKAQRAAQGLPQHPALPNSSRP